MAYHPTQVWYSIRLDFIFLYHPSALTVEVDNNSYFGVRPNKEHCVYLGELE